MAEKETAKDKKIKTLLLDLGSKDEKVQLKAVKALKVHGNETVIEPLLLMLVNDASPAVYAEICEILNTIKFTSVPEKIASALVDKRFTSIRQELLISIWNSGLDYRPYLKEIMMAGVEGEMMDALECITIVENIEGELTEDELFEPLIVLTEYIASNRSESGAKLDLLKEITLDLQNRNNLL